jgi:hypothetical protein
MKLGPSDELFKMAEPVLVDGKWVDPNAKPKLSPEEYYAKLEEARERFKLEKEEKRVKKLDEKRTKRYEEFRDKDPGVTGPIQAFAIGYLAKKGIVNIQVPDRDEHGYDYVTEFKRRYKIITGEDLQDSSNFQISNRLTTEGKLAKFSEELSIALGNTPPDIMAKILGSLTFTSSGGRLYGSSEVWQLIRRGFRAGLNVNNISKIRESIPEEFKKDFDLGASY